MSRLFYHVMQDNAGNLLFDVSGTMRIAGSGTLATIYGDEALTVILPNPMTNHPSFGSFKCFLGAGDYDFYMAKGGYTFETLTGVQGHGTLAQQDANAVAITGGTISNVTLPLGTMATQNANNVTITGGVGALTALGLNRVANLGNPLEIGYQQVGFGIVMVPNADSGAGAAMLFTNAALAQVGTIRTTATATAYNTTSDARLKHAIEALTGALDRVRALRPVSYLWNADDSPGEGFLADELMQHIPAAVTGEPNAVDEAGNIVPQGVDHSKIVPHLVAACQELAAQVQTLTARLMAVETGGGSPGSA